MKFNLGCFAVALIITALHGCKNGDETKLIIYTRAPLKSTLYIKRIGYFDEKEAVIDSAIIKDNHDSLVFFIPKAEERLFKVTLKDNYRLQTTFINDTRIIRIHADYFADTCNIWGSPASLSLKKFDESQLRFSEYLKELGKPVDSLKRSGKKSKQLDSLLKKFNTELAGYFTSYKNYADTVKSSASFMRVFNTIDFGPDHKALKRFIVRNAARFPASKPIQELKRQTLLTVKIYEEELNVGDKIPAISLVDKNDLPYSTAALAGKYYLIDFWSTWCQQCVAFKSAEYHLYQADPKMAVQFIGVALDDNVDEWKKLVKQFKHPSVELIDSKMWQGPAVNTLLFDSIPFNFLVNPQGKIIAKAIKPDSLAKVIRGLIKK